jgi:hypothetical protein
VCVLHKSIDQREPQAYPQPISGSEVRGRQSGSRRACRPRFCRYVKHRNELCQTT